MAHLALSARGTIALTGAERPVPVTGNAAAIADALRNIIENSLAHTAPGTEVIVEVGPQGAIMDRQRDTLSPRGLVLMKDASRQMRGCALVAQRRRCLICRGPRRPPGDQGDRRAQHDQNGAENDKAPSGAPVVGDAAHQGRDNDRRQAVHGLPQPDHRTLTVRPDGLGLHRKHHRLDNPLQPAA